MVASGKSSNRFGEWRRGYNGTLEVGPYALAGKLDREREEEEKRREQEERDEKPTRREYPT